MSTSPLLTDEAVAFVTDLQRRFGPRRDELLAGPSRRSPGRRATSSPRPRTSGPRTGRWRPRRPHLLDRRVEITGPTEPKMAVNALNSGAKVWLADLEDANTPHWPNVLEGQQVLHDAARHRLAFTSPEGKALRAARRPAGGPWSARGAGTSTSSTCRSTADR